MQNKKRTPLDAQQTHLWIIGGGIAGMAAAAFAIRDAKVPAKNIHILEELDISGGSMDGGQTPHAAQAWVTRGGRMLTDETYLCLWDLFSSIPSLENPNVSMLRLLASKEEKIGSRRIDEFFDEAFFETNFWRMWRTTFAFQKWHSAAELRRYFLRFIQELPRIHTLAGVKRTKYNQYDSMILPLQRWLVAQGVDVRFGHYVTDADFITNAETQERHTSRLYVQLPEGSEQINLKANDLAIFTLGSITADSRYGGNHDVPALIRHREDHGWTLWETLAQKAPDFGRPMTFYGNVDEHKWESFTLTMKDDVLLKRIVDYTGNEPGTGALMTWYESGWHLSIVVPAQPHFADLPEGLYTLWGYGFQIDHMGDYIKKPMSEATGQEILTELIKQLGFDDILDHVLATTDVTTAMMPYASALFACRKLGDRPQVIPQGSQNFAFLGQFVEIEDDVVFTVEYSVRGAMLAIYEFFGVEREIPEIYNGLLDPKVGLKALETVFH
ncbi:hypothetical protein LTR94_015162 [Friedmanniomyces endolithicus]|nr:hypothetical protein LTR94_015162 [Friedmanniomyces endolithicus]